MLRLRFLRLLLPVLIVGLGALLWFSFKPRPSSARLTEPGEAPQQTVATDVSIEDFEDVDGGDVMTLVQQTDGSLQMEGIADIKIPREGREPLIVSAANGMRQGKTGRWTFSDEVRFTDPQKGMSVELSSLEIDIDAGVARSSNQVTFTGRDYTGTASSIEYGLEGQPGVLHQPRLEDRKDGYLFGERAVLNDGLRDVEIKGAVRAEQSGKRLAASVVRLIRDADDRLRQATAGGDVEIGWQSKSEAPAQLNGKTLEVLWDPAGDPESLLVEGDASFRRASDSLDAERLSAARLNGFWRVEAVGAARVSAGTSVGRSRLEADRLLGIFDGAMKLREGEAEGNVEFDSGDVSAEASRALFKHEEPDVDRIELFGDELNKAWLARPRNRVAAVSVSTDLAGSRLNAQGAVEATLLPESRPDAAVDSSKGRRRLFLVDQAVHFVSESLESLEGGNLLRFSGQVRGWQGERNLAGDEVEMDQRTSALSARGDVATRLPREEDSPASSAADFVQINAGALDYDDAAGTATYSGGVRVRLDEGWLEGETMVVVIGVDSRRVEEIRAYETVRLELNRRSDGALANPISGSADRLVYRPSESKVILYGLDAPAVVRRQGEGGGTTKGRELHYRLDTEALEVKSGTQDGGTIRS